MLRQTRNDAVLSKAAAHCESYLDFPFVNGIISTFFTMHESTVDSAFNELGYDKIWEFLNINFFKTDFSKQRYYYEGEQDFIFLWSLEFR